MNVLALEIPEDPAALADWLERRVVGIELGDLVAQLSLGGTNETPQALEDLLGETAPGVFEQGLSVCSDEQLRSLLANPAALLELQEQVFISGGVHWLEVELDKEHRDAAARVAAVAKRAEARTVALSTPATLGRRQWAVLAIAASVLLALGVWATRPPANPPGWGFDRQGLLAQQVDASGYLDSLAAAAGEWFNKQPQDAPQLVTRLKGFRRGCDTLLAAPHSQLAAGDKAWLLERCRAWRDRIDGLLADLEADPETHMQARQTADALVRQMQKALDSRSQEAASA